MVEETQENPSPVSVVPIIDDGLGNSSYLVDLGDGGALVIDPRRDPRPHLRELRDRRLKARLVAETHLHADFVSGSAELMARGVELWAPAESRLKYPHRGLRDHEEADLGGLRLRVVATPGHTPEHLAYLLLDGARPVALFSGGTLTAGGAARTDLLSPDQSEPLARAAYRSVRERLFTLPGDLAVYPTHGGGSFCSVGSGGRLSTTIAEERRLNPLFADDADEDTFLRRLFAGYGSYPPYFRELREVNRHGVEVYGERQPSLKRLSLPAFERIAGEGGVVLDVRSISSFAAGHLPGAISNPWRPQFGTWLGWLLPRDATILFVADESVDRLNLMWAALTIGYENLAGELDGGMRAWEEASRDVARIPLTRSNPDRRQVIDVRQASEYDAGHLPGATHVELGALAESTAEIPHDRLLLHCGHGERAMTAASLLTRAGHHDVAVLEGPPRRLGPTVATGAT